MNPDELNQTGQEAIQQVLHLLSAWGMQVVGAIALLVVGYWLAGRAERVTRRAVDFCVMETAEDCADAADIDAPPAAAGAAGPGPSLSKMK